MKFAEGTKMEGCGTKAAARERNADALLLTADMDGHDIPLGWKETDPRDTGVLMHRACPD